MTITIKKGSSIILQDKSKIVEGGEIHGGFINFLIPILAAAAGPVLANILNKVVDKVSGKSLTLELPNQPILAAAAGPVLANILNKVVDKVSGKSLTLELPNQPPIPLKKTLSQKDKDTIEKNISKNNKHHQPQFTSLEF
ncbi:hypothetical protein QE152_g36680 [Popillia japonica]|uniref:Uncharacterized protein n=1 Tax=Popillia japonica TaxID=7064 RepID=A0AAW1ID39_POPJA